MTDFRTGQENLIDVPTPGGPGADDGHGGGDEGLVRAFTQAVRSGRSEPYLASAAESLASHRLTWSAERARLTGTVVELDAPRVGR